MSRMMYKRPVRYLRTGLLCVPVSLEGDSRRHLDLPRAADRLIRNAQAPGAVIEAGVRLCTLRCAARGQWSCSLHGEAVVELVLRYVVSGDVEACGVGYIEDVEGIFESDAL